MEEFDANKKKAGMQITPSEFVLPTVDVSYLYRFEKTLNELEKALHSDDDPETIARGTMEVARDFYDADWCGMVTADIESKVFYPVWWANRDESRQKSTLFEEVEFLDDYAHWIDALRHNKPVILNSLEQVSDSVSSTEQQHYAKMNVHSVIGWPLYYHRPYGFLIIKNPQIYQTEPGMLAILAYVVLNCWKEQQNLEAFRMQIKSPCGALKEDRDIYFRLFGEPELHTMRGELSAATLNSPKLWRLICYLVLHKKPVPIRTIAEALFPDEDPESAVNALRVTMSRTKPKLEPILDENLPLIKNSEYGYQINPQYHVMTDLDEFEKIAAIAKRQPELRERIESYKKAVKLYRGPLYKEASAEHWLLSTVEHYAVRYADAVNHLLADLAALKDYESIQHFASHALDIEPGNATAVYWLLVSLTKIGLQHNAKAEYERAKQFLTEPALAELEQKMHEFEKLNGKGMSE